MSVEKGLSLKEFEFEGSSQTLEFIESVGVTDGVECDVYSFEGDDSKDLGIIRIDSGCKTPLQRVLGGERTIEGFISGKGQLFITRQDGSEEVYAVGEDPEEDLAVEVNVGDLMQWQASIDSDLIAYEVCYPPYEDGRYENLE